MELQFDVQVIPLSKIAATIKTSAQCQKQVQMRRSWKFSDIKLLYNMSFISSWLISDSKSFFPPNQ